MQGSPTTASADEAHSAPLDGIRGIAILMVLCAHAADALQVLPPSTGRAQMLVRSFFLLGSGGVDVFFALSGFLITGILLKTRERPGYFRTFYARRILRIFPLYYMFLGLSLVLGLLSRELHQLQPHTWAERLPFLFYLQNWPAFWDDWGGLMTVWGVFWSLAVEEQFYLVWPAVTRWVPRTWLLGTCVVGALAGLPVREYLIEQHGLIFGVMQTPFSRLDGLFLGAGIALYRGWVGKPLPRMWGWMAVGIAAMMLLWVVAWYPAELRTAGRHLWVLSPLAMSLMAGGLIVLVEHRGRMVSRVLGNRLLVAAGRYSYGMYVYHLLVFTLITVARFKWARGLGSTPPARVGIGLFVGAIALVAVVAKLSFDYFETPFLRLKRFFPSPAPPV